MGINTGGTKEVEVIANLTKLRDNMGGFPQQYGGVN